LLEQIDCTVGQFPRLAIVDVYGENDPASF